MAASRPRARRCWQCGTFAPRPGPVDTDDGTIVAVNDVSLDLFGGEVLAVVGESGCGKTMLALSILGLLPGRARIAAGEVRLAGEDLLSASALRRRQVRGAEIAMIFQDPLTASEPGAARGRPDRRDDQSPSAAAQD